MEKLFSDLKLVIYEIVSLLEKTSSSVWKEEFIHFHKKLLNLSLSDRDALKDFSRDILKVYGGMGSFSDFVLYKEGESYIEENNRLALLRSKLFKICTEIIST